MKPMLALSLMVLAIVFPSLAQQSVESKPVFQMDTYQVGLFKRGPKQSVGQTDESRRIQSEHLAHIGKMAESGKDCGVACQ